MACSSNQIAGDCFSQGGACNKECSPSEVGDMTSTCSDMSGPGAGMYGFTKGCPTTALAHPRVNEGYPTEKKRGRGMCIGGAVILAVAAIIFLLWYRHHY